MKTFFVLISILILLTGDTVYCKGILKGSIKPNRVSFILWFLFPMPTFWAQYVKGFSVETIFLGIVIVMPIAIIICSYIAKDGYWKITLFDIALGVLSISGFIVSLSLSDIYLAVTATLITDFLAAVPTIRKSWIDPHSEGISAYISISGSAFFSVLASSDINYVSTAFNVYIFLIGIGLSLIIQLRQKRVTKA